jgi:hypothetical protein
MCMLWVCVSMCVSSGDSFGDACDLTPLLPFTTNDDTDSDGGAAQIVLAAPPTHISLPLQGYKSCTRTPPPPPYALLGPLVLVFVHPPRSIVG